MRCLPPRLIKPCSINKLRPQLETLYCESNGRPAIDPVLLCGVTLLQFMEKVSDRRAAEQVAYHLGWKYALELELAYQGFHPTVLVYFRDRLEENQALRVIFDGIVDSLAGEGSFLEITDSGLWHQTDRCKQNSCDKNSAANPFASRS